MSTGPVQPEKGCHVQPCHGVRWPAPHFSMLGLALQPPCYWGQSAFFPLLNPHVSKSCR